jgi:hypothetical protein
MNVNFILEVMILLVVPTLMAIGLYAVVRDIHRAKGLAQKEKEIEVKQVENEVFRSFVQTPARQVRLSAIQVQGRLYSDTTQSGLELPRAVPDYLRRVQ